MADEADNIVNFRSGAPSARLKHLDWSDERTRCQHKRVEVWAKEPILECADCKAIVDPYQWIRDRCRDWDEIESTHKFRKAEMKSEENSLRKALRLLRGEYADVKERREAERSLMVLPKRGFT